MKLILFAALLLTTFGQLTTQQVNKTISEACKTTNECVAKLGSGACCLREENSTSIAYVCRNKDFVDYYYDPLNYDFKTRQWTNPEDPTDRLQVYCRSTNTYNSTQYRYPFTQQWLPAGQYSPILVDQINNNVRSDMFFYPSPVMGWSDQLAKWFAAWFWFWTPLPLLAAINNGFFYLWDWIQYDFDPATQGIRPTMYNNWFTQLFMGGDSGPWGPFKWYDMFSLAGWLDWFIDSLALIVIPWWELLEAIFRSDRNSWGYMSSELDNNVDRNRILQWNKTPFTDPYDYGYWSTRDQGKDCNGNVGQGYFCYCPSQGYQCSCKVSEWAPTKKKDMCFDHYGFDCMGNWVDGETNWCQDRQSPYWQVNLQRQNSI